LRPSVAANYPSLTLLGDPECPVDVVGVGVLTPWCFDPAQSVGVNCTYSAGGVYSTLLTLNRSSTTVACSLTGWNGPRALYRCPMASLGVGEYTVNCSVNTTASASAVPRMLSSLVLNDVNDPCVGGICNLARVCTDRVTWVSTVRDEVTGLPISDVFLPLRVTIDGVTTSGLGKSFSLPVGVGTRSVTVAAASGYLPRSFQLVAARDPVVQDVFLREPECESDCTKGGYCDYRCRTVNVACGAAFSALPADDQALLLKYCGTGLVPVGAVRDLRPDDATRVARCCLGFTPVSEYRAPLTIESCSENIAQQRTVVNVDGKFLQLTVASYRPCK